MTVSKCVEGMCMLFTLLCENAAMAMMISILIATVKPNIKAIRNGDGSYAAHD